jgi:hypothetical protein
LTQKLSKISEIHENFAVRRKDVAFHGRADAEVVAVQMFATTFEMIELVGCAEFVLDGQPPASGAGVVSVCMHQRGRLLWEGTRCAGSRARGLTSHFIMVEGADSSVKYI